MVRGTDDPLGTRAPGLADWANWYRQKLDAYVARAGAESMEDFNRNYATGVFGI